jgi:HSP20 family molecular chaperone IbpA
MFPSKLFLDDVFKFDEKSKMICDVYEKDNKFFIEVDMPGFKKDEIKIEINKGTLNITAEKKYEEQEEDKKYLCHERKFYGKYQRSFYLGDVEEDAIEASFDNGTLNIEIPKKQEQNNNRMIEIK